MKNSWRAFVATVSLCLATAAAASPGPDYSDLWWNPAEDGWGVGLQRQGDVIFLTLFVYGADRAGTWFVAPEVRLMDFSAGPPTWQGTLYRTRGPGFAASFDASSVESSEAGWATLTFAGNESGTLRYSVDGTVVTKEITRMTWRAPSPAGRYHGGYSANVSQCEAAGRGGPDELIGSMTVTRTGDQVAAQFVSKRAGDNSSCTFAGTERHSGRLAHWTGTFNCNVLIGGDDRGEGTTRATRTGPFTVRNITTTADGFWGELSAADQDCAYAGHFGGTRLP